jgi:hypothetical protein
MGGYYPETSKWRHKRRLDMDVADWEKVDYI